MCFTATENGEVIAYVIGRLIAPEGEIYRVAVAPHKRQRGIGYRLLDYAVKTSKGQGLERLFLEVRSRNIPAIRLYTAYGFKEIGVRKRYYKDPEDDAIVMLRAHSADMQF
jgi:ribosomal-protein-alanine N-acetyltransferase